MTLYSYKKALPKKKKRAKILPIVSLALGATFISMVFYSTAGFNLKYGSKFTTLKSPIASKIDKKINKDHLVALAEEKNKTLSIDKNNFTYQKDADLTQASLWFPKAIPHNLPRSHSSYILSIPKLNIEDARVLVGAEDLSKSLIHFTGPLPGLNGNPVIFGHSTLPFLYNPQDYKSIFSKLPDLEKNDEIYVKVDNITYKYLVSEMEVVDPDNLTVLDQEYSSPLLTLITCVPPGTYQKRLVLKARLVQI